MLEITDRSHLGRVGGCSRLAEVRLQEGESLENALRRFKRKVQQEDIIKEVKRHSFYLKPGEKKTLRFTLGKDELSYWSAQEKRWVMESEMFDVWVGGDSTASLHGTFTPRPEVMR